MSALPICRARRGHAGNGQPTTVYVLVIDLAGNADDLASVFSNEAARQERYRQEEFDTKAERCLR